MIFIITLSILTFIIPIHTVSFITLHHKTYSYMQLNSSYAFHNYILTKQETHHSFFLIEIAEEPKNASLPFSYISYAVEYYTDTPTYTNSTNVTIYSESSYGKTTLIIPINNNNTFIFSVFYVDNTTYQYPINYIIKYKSSQTRNDIVSYNFNTTFQAYHLRRSGYIYFEEIFTSPNDIKSSLYYLKFYPKTELHNSNTVYTIYQRSNLSIINEQINTPNLHMKITYYISFKDNNFDLYTTLCVFVITLNNEEVIRCYDVIELKEKEKLYETPLPNKYYYYKLNKTEQTKTYRLIENVNRSKYYQIEFAWEPFALAEGDYITSYSAEEYAERPTKIHGYHIHEKRNIVNNGRKVLLMHQYNDIETDIIFTMNVYENYSNYHRNNNASVGFMMKWKQIENENDFWNYNDLSITNTTFIVSQRKRNEANVSFRNYFFNNKCNECISKVIMLSLYSKNKMRSINYVNNIYTYNQPAIIRKNYTESEFNGKEIINEHFILNSEDCCEWFITAQVYFINKTTNDEVWLSYNATVIADADKQIQTQTARTFNYVEVSDIITVLLSKERYEDTLLYIEMASTLIDDTNHNIDIIIEKYNESYSYVHDKEINLLSKNTSCGKDSYLFTFPQNVFDYDVLVHFNSIHKNNLHLMFKYFTFKNENEFYKYKSYENKISFNNGNNNNSNSIYTEHFGKRIIVKFKDIFNHTLKKTYKSAIYNIILYNGNKNNIPYNSIYIDNSTINILKEINITSDFKGNDQHIIITLDKRISNIYININLHFTAVDDIEYTILLSTIKTLYISDIVIMSIIICLSFILLIIIIYLICACKNKRKLKLIIEKGIMKMNETLPENILPLNESVTSNDNSAL